MSGRSAALLHGREWMSGLPVTLDHLLGSFARARLLA